MDLQRAGTTEELRQSLGTFAAALRAGDSRAEFSIRHPGYWVHDPRDDSIAPAKWVAFSNMTADRYAALQERQRSTPVRGFNGTRARRHVERLTGRAFEPNGKLLEQLTQRFKSAFGQDCLSNRDLSSLVFLSLDRSDSNLHYQVRDELLETYRRLVSDEKIDKQDDLDRYKRAFIERFGPEALKALDGEALLRHMHEHGTQDSLVYWLEFKNDEEFPEIFGSIGGGSALKFGIYRKRETGAWMTGSPASQYEISVEEAIEIARRHRDELIASVEAIAALPAQASDEDYAKLQTTLEQVAPAVQNTVWGHKYCSLIHPDKIDQFHVENWQRFNLVRILQEPPPTPGRYVSAGRYVALANELDLSLSHTCRTLVSRNGWPFAYRRFDIGNSTEGKQHWRSMVDRKCIGPDWGDAEDLPETKRRVELRDQLAATYSWTHEQADRESRALWELRKRVRPRDRVLVCRGDKAIAICEIEETYQFAPDSPFPHSAPMRVLDNTTWEPGFEQPARMNFEEIRDNPRLLIEIERRLLDPDRVQRPPVGPTPPKPVRVALDGMPGKIQRVLDRKGQVILYGPPGTGKTYWAEKAAKDIVATRLLGKRFDELAGEEQERVFGKSAANTGLVRLCSFHPAYGYEDFIEGYRPNLHGDQLSFGVEPGIFLQMCRDAADAPDTPHILIIDEINRGDIPRIFGELLTVLELSKRNMPILLPLTGKTLRVPRNLSVIGTMNTADRSIALLDTALRRRFGFIELMPDPTVLKDTEIEGIPINKWLDVLNRRICESIGRDARNLQIGHSYLMVQGKPVSDMGQFRRILSEDILPLLEEYCYDDWDALKSILGSGFVDLKRQQFKDDLFGLDQAPNLIQALMAIDPSLATTGDATDGADEDSEDEAADPEDDVEPGDEA